MTNIEEWLHE